MKTEYYQKVIIESEKDLPKDTGIYICRDTSRQIIVDVRRDIDIPANRKYWLENIAWYYLPVQSISEEAPELTDEEIEKEAKWRFTNGHGAESEFCIGVFINAIEWYRKSLREKGGKG